MFSEEAKEVFDALWKYYHGQENINVNASLYDIREFFQGRNNKGKMNNSSNDETYMELIRELRNKLKFLANKIKPKIYEYLATMCIFCGPKYSQNEIYTLKINFFC